MFSISATIFSIQSAYYKYQIFEETKNIVIRL